MPLNPGAGLGAAAGRRPGELFRRECWRQVIGRPPTVKSGQQIDGAMVFSWIRARRRRQLLQEPIAEEWRGLLSRRVRHYQYLDTGKREWLEGEVRVLVAE